MQIEIAPTEGVRVLRLRGDFERLALADARIAIDRALAESDNWVILNLAEVSFIDSSSVNYLLRARRRAEAEGGDLVLAEASPFVRTILGTLGIDGIFQQFDTEAEAVEQLGG